MTNIETAAKNPYKAYLRTGDTNDFKSNPAQKYTPTITPVMNQNANFK